MLSARFKPAKVRDLGSPAGVITKALIVFLLSQTFALTLVGIFLGLAHPHTTSTDISTLLDQSIPAQFVYILIAESLAAGLVIWLVRRRRLGLGFIGLGRKPQLNDALQAIYGIAIFYVLVFAAGILLSIFLPNFNTNQTQNLGFNTISTTGGNLLAFLALVILPPFGEEPLVRGYLYSGLRFRLSYRRAMLITSLLFGLAHLEIGSGSPLVWGAAIDTFILSLVLVRLREHTGALWAGILLHMVNNAVAFGVHFH